MSHQKPKNFNKMKNEKTLVEQTQIKKCFKCKGVTITTKIFGKAAKWTYCKCTK